MRYTDIAIVGGGLAGSTAAAMLGRAGISTVLIDPHEAYPPDFRVEKISGPAQVDAFWRMGFAESVLGQHNRVWAGRKAASRVDAEKHVFCGRFLTRRLHQ